MGIFGAVALCQRLFDVLDLIKKDANAEKDIDAQYASSGEKNEMENMKEGNRNNETESVHTK